MADTSIEWTDTVWNPTTGCDRVSLGCDNCYALTMAKRLKAMGSAKYQVDGDPRTSGPGFGIQVHPTTLADPYRWAQPRRVFVNSVSDLFHPKVPLAFVSQVIKVIEETPQHQYQVLTKRPLRAARAAGKLRWPDNLWLGTSIETDAYVDRADHLRTVPAAVQFLSLEPLLGPVPSLDLTAIDWVIVGGESGPGFRAIEAVWVDDIQQRGAARGVAFFFKQWGGQTPKAGGRELSGRTYDEMPRPLERTIR